MKTIPLLLLLALLAGCSQPKVEAIDPEVLSGYDSISLQVPPEGNFYITIASTSGNETWNTVTAGIIGHDGSPDNDYWPGFHFHVNDAASTHDPPFDNKPITPEPVSSESITIQVGDRVYVCGPIPHAFVVLTTSSSPSMVELTEIPECLP